MSVQSNESNECNSISNEQVQRQDKFFTILTPNQIIFLNTYPEHIKII